MKTTLFADDTVSLKRHNSVEKLQKSINCEMTKVTDWLTANKLSLSISKTKYLLITNKHDSTDLFEMNLNFNGKEFRITSTLVQLQQCWIARGL